MAANPLTGGELLSCLMVRSVVLTGGFDQSSLRTPYLLRGISQGSGHTCVGCRNSLLLKQLQMLFLDGLPDFLLAELTKDPCARRYIVLAAELGVLQVRPDGSIQALRIIRLHAWL